MPKPATGDGLPTLDPAPPPRAAEAETLAPDGAAASPAAPPAVPGYEIEGELGRGGMGVVYRAKQTALGRTVALKMILAGAHASASDRARFRREAEAVARLQHPGIVQVHEVGEHDGRPFFSLELCAGGGLDKRLDGTPLPPAEAARLVEVLARAVHYAHQHGVVHRDLKPANVLFTADGALKITDFGLAKRLGETGQTATGAILGTPSYMAPEQADGRGREVGPAADVYALGAILYELLTGRPPFRAATPVDTILQVIADEPVPPGRLQRRLPRDAETVCLKCLEKDPKKRYTSALELADDLARFLKGEPIRARPVGRLERGWRWCRRNPAVATLLGAVALLLAALTAGSLAAAWRERDLRTATDQARQDAEGKAEEARRRLVRLNVMTGLHHLDQGDSSGALVWFAEALAGDEGDPEREEVHRLRLAAVAGACPELLRAWCPDLPPHHAEFSPDGRTVLAACGGDNQGWGVTNGEARLWDVASGRPPFPPVRHTGYVIHATFRPDGRAFATASGSAAGNGGEARVWSAADGTPLSPPLPHRFPVNCAAFSPDGKRLVTAAGSAYGDNPGGEARVWDLTTGRSVTLAHAARVNQAAFNRDGSQVVTASGALGPGEAQVWDAATGKPLAGPFRHAAAVNSACFSPDGRRVLTAGRDGWARLWDLGGRGAPPPPLFQHRAEVYGASFSPDGKRVLTACQDGTAQVWDATNGALIGPPLRHAGPVRHAAFSPDGRRVLTASGDPLGREGEARAWAAATGQPLTPWLRHNGAVRSVAFSPDGTRILTAGGDRLVKLWGPPAGGPAARSLRGRVTGMRVPLSPDGRLVLGGEGNRAQVWDTVTGARVGPDLPHSQPVSAGLFAADGRRLVTFCPRPVGQAEARVWELPAGRPLAESVRGWVSALSADGRLLVTIDGDTAQVREADTGAPVGPALKHDRPVHLVAFSPDGRLLATVAYSKVHLWEVTTGKLVVAPLRHEYTVVSIQFSADGRRLVTASYLQGRPGDLIGEGEARVWDVARGEPAGVPLKHRGAVTEAHFSPDPEGRRVLTAGSDRTARVWDTATSRPLTPPLVHPGSVTQARFSPDGRYALTVSDGAARVWDAATGDPVTPPLLGKVKAQTAAFGPGGRSLTVAGFGQNTTEVEGWALRPDALPAAEWMRRARLLAGRELDATGGLVPLVPERLCEELAKQPQPAVRAREDKMPR